LKEEKGKAIENVGSLIQLLFPFIGEENPQTLKLKKQI